jgi:hypothetical protein
LGMYIWSAAGARHPLVRGGGNLDVLEGGVLAKEGGCDHNLVLAGVQLPDREDVGLVTAGRAGIPYFCRPLYVVHLTCATALEDLQGQTPIKTHDTKNLPTLDGVLRT